MTAAEFSHVTFISAGAGSGKTYRLTEELERALVDGGVQPSGVIGTTFTVKAAGELKDRVRERLIRSGRPQLAEQMSQALIGTVHSVCQRLLERFVFELGLSPQLNVLGVSDQRLFHQALDEVSSPDQVREMNALAARLSSDDWRLDVKRIADRARDNDVAAAALTLMGRDSADSLLAFFPATTRTDHRAALVRAIEAARVAIDVTTDTTALTRDYLELLNSARYLLERDCAWSLWFKLSKAKPGARNAVHAAAVRQAAQCYETHPEFCADIRDYIERVYSIAVATLGRFQALKTERGLIDFTDMEQLTLRALDNAHVALRLEDELELLLVDEFQDTNPMQLALFVKLARFAKRVVFVGDVKQAIYAFRGCDPELVFATLAGLTRRGARIDILEFSWRSRPPLVSYLNQVFSRAFANDAIDPAHVELTARRAGHIDTAAVVQWRASGTRTSQIEALARGVAKLVADATTVVDAETNQPRALRFGDIAILARTNDHIEDLALALKAERVPIKMSLKGLLATPEVCFAKACLRRLTDPTDTLSTAEIVAFADGSNADVWLAQRLGFLATGAPSGDWLEDSHPVVKRLAQLRAEVVYQSPLETVARVLNDVGIREVAAGWGPDAVKVSQRQRNLDAFLNLAVEYETFCASQHEAATLTGFLFWAQDPHSPELDLQPTVTTGDAVHVLTYHKAKGLEWPVVIVADFEAAVRNNVWDVRVNLVAPFDVNDPLAARTIRFWPKIFGDNTKGIPILDAIDASAEGLGCEAGTAAEQRRLAYVGMTRARDVLIICLPDKPLKNGAWFTTFADESMLPGGGELLLPNGDLISSAYAALPSDGLLSTPLPYAPRWFEQRPRPTVQLREALSPSRAPPVDGATIGEVVELGSRIVVRGDDMNLIGSALHAVIAAELVNPDRRDADLRAQEILRGYGADAWVDADAAVACARRFRAFIIERFEPTRILAEVPAAVRVRSGQLSRGWIDVLLETADGWVVIDHKSSPRGKSEWEPAALAHSGQLAWYRSMLAAAGARLAPSAWIHFPVSGGMIRINTDSRP